MHVQIALLTSVLKLMLFYQNVVNRHADDDEKALKSQREQGAQIVLAHAI